MDESQAEFEKMLPPVPITGTSISGFSVSFSRSSSCVKRINSVVTDMCAISVDSMVERSGCALDFSDPRAIFSGLGFGKTAIFAPHLNHLQCISSNVYISISHPYSIKPPPEFLESLK
jgi:hypothetical protein